MTEIETALLDALESLENNRRATERRMMSALEDLESNHAAIEQRVMNALTHLGERLAELEQENTDLMQKLASLAGVLARQSEAQNAQAALQQRQSETLKQLAER